MASKERFLPSSLFSIFTTTTTTTTIHHQSTSFPHLFITNALSILLDTNQTLNNSTSSNQTDCSPILFNLGKWSTEKEPKLEYGLCPDSIITPIFSSIFLATFLGISIVSLMGMIWKRQNGFIQARNPIYMFMTFVAAFIFIVGNGLRFMIGRKVFPCAIYTVLFFVLPPLVSLPTILRCLRLFFMYKLNLQKTKLFEMKNMSKSNQNIQTTDQSINTQIQSFELSSSNTTQSSTNGGLENSNRNLFITSSEKQIYGNEDLIHRRSNITEFINNSTSIDPEKVIEANVKGIDIKTASVVSPILNPVDNQSGNVDFSTSHYSNGSSTVENMSQQDLVDSSPRIFKNSEHLFDDNVTETDDSDSFSDIDTRSTWAFKDLSDLRSEVRTFQIFTFLSSYKFVLILYAIFVTFQLALWLILGGVEEAIFSNSSNSGERIFLLEGGMLVFERGCSMSTKMVLIIAGESVIYIVFEIIALVLCIRSDRDTWSVKKEAIIIIIFQVVSLIAFVVTGLIEPIVTLTDYFIPYGYAVMTFSLVEVFTSVLLPVIYAIVSEYRNFKRMNTEFDSELEHVLHNKKSFNKILDFARRSYAPESVLCYRDIQRFKKLRAGNRRKMAQHIVNSYLSIGSPLELNINNIEARKKEFSEKLSNTNEKLPRNLFNLIQDHCLVDMRDIFDRLRNSDKEIFQIIQDWRMKQSKLITN